MTDCCNDKACEIEALRNRQSATLKVVLGINAAMFAVERTAGLLSGLGNYSAPPNFASSLVIAPSSRGGFILDSRNRLDCRWISYWAANPSEQRDETNPKSYAESQNRGLMKSKITYWQEKDGKFLGYLNEFPDYWTQGEDHADLVEHLRDLYHELSQGDSPGIRRVKEIEVG
jgi:hypothetical protein